MNPINQYQELIKSLHSINSNANTPYDQKKRASYELFYRYSSLILSNNELSDLEKVEIIESVHSEINTELTKLIN